MTLLKPIRITSSEHVEILRQIYNENLDMLGTIMLPHRSYEEQQNWWNENKYKLEGYLYECVGISNDSIAFLVLTNKGNFKTPIIAIKKKYWGKGYAKEIISDYIEKANSPLAGSQFQSNGAICHLNKKMGWQIIGQSNQPNGIIDLLYHPGINLDKKDDIFIYNEIVNYLNEKHKPL